MPSPKHPTLCLLFSNGVYTLPSLCFWLLRWTKMWWASESQRWVYHQHGALSVKPWEVRSPFAGNHRLRERGMQRGLIEESGKKTRGAGGGGQRGKRVKRRCRSRTRRRGRRISGAMKIRAVCKTLGSNKTLGNHSEVGGGRKMEGWLKLAYPSSS